MPITKCDRCGKEYNPVETAHCTIEHEDFYQPILSKDFEYRYNTFDLCKVCSWDFNKFMKGAKIACNES